MSLTRPTFTRLNNRDPYWTALFLVVYILALGMYSRLPRDHAAEEAYWSQVYPRSHLVSGCAFVVTTIDIFFNGCLFDMNAYKRALSYMAMYIYVASAITCFSLEFRLLPVYFDAFGKIFCPSHFVSWLFTTPVMVYILSHISRFTDRQTLKLVAIDAMAIVSGMLSLVDLPGRLNMVAGLCGLVLFVVLMNSFMQMYQTGVESVLMQGSDRISAITRNAILAMRAQVIFTIFLWSAFPVVWFLANIGLITGAQQELGFTVMNLLSKILFSTSTLLSNFAILGAENRVECVMDVEEVIQKEVFLNSVSQELRDPLDGIIGLSEWLVGDAQGLDPRVRKCYTLIRNSGVNLLSLVTDILDLLASRSGDMVMDFDDVDVGEIIRHVLATLKPLASENVSMRYQVAGFVPKIKADRRRIGQILNNLVGNSLKFTRQGNVSVSAQFSTNEDGVILRISDTGIGIPQDKIDTIFEEFEQVDGNVRREFGGTGLGLAIVKQLVELHQGRISVASRVGVGSTFTVFLPRSQAATPAGRSAVVKRATEVGRTSRLSMEEVVRHTASREYNRLMMEMDTVEYGPADSPTPFPLDEFDRFGGRGTAVGQPGGRASPMSPQTTATSRKGATLPTAEPQRRVRHREVNGGKILVLSVDDDEVNQMVIQEILENHGLEMEVAMDGESALEFIRTQPYLPDLILLDMMMPGLSGIDVATYVRQRLKISTEDMPIIMVSALSSEAVIGQARAAGCDDYILKPVSPKFVMSSIHRLLPSSRAALKLANFDGSEDGDLEAEGEEEEEEEGEKEVNVAATAQVAETTMSVRGSILVDEQTPSPAPMPLLAHLARLNDTEEPMPSFAGHVPPANGERASIGRDISPTDAGIELTRRYLESLGDTVTSSAGFEETGKGNDSFPGLAAHRQIGVSDISSIDTPGMFGPRGIPTIISDPTVAPGPTSQASRRSMAATDLAALVTSDGVISVDDLLTGRIDRYLAASALKSSHRFAGNGNGEGFILCIDEDALIQSLLDTIVDYIPGFRVMHAGRPTTALEFIKLSAHLPDLVVLESRMPEMNGLELTRVLRRTFSARHLPIVMVSSEPRLADEALQAGCNRFIAKPFNVRTFAEEVVAVLHDQADGLSPLLQEQYTTYTARGLGVPRSKSSKDSAKDAPRTYVPGLDRSSLDAQVAQMRKSVGSIGTSSHAITSGSLRAAAAAARILEDRALPQSGGSFTTAASTAAFLPYAQAPAPRPSDVTSSTISSAPPPVSAAATSAPTTPQAAAIGSSTAASRTVICILTAEEFNAAVQQGARAVGGDSVQVLSFSSAMQAMTRLFTMRTEPCLAVVDLEEETAARSELISALRERAGSEGVKVVAIGGDDQMEVAMDLDCEDFLVKPLSSKKLQAVVERLLAI